MTRHIFWLLCALLTLPASAAEAPAPDASQTPAQSAAAAESPTDPLLAEAAAAAAAPPPPAPREESFTPTVQISEDLSVSFPVDI